MEIFVAWIIIIKKMIAEADSPTAMQHSLWNWARSILL
jgi:hypothetical protein